MASPPTTVHRAAYRAQQGSIRLPCLAAQRLLRLVSRRQEEPPAEIVTAVQRRYEELLQRDVGNVEAGYYPRELLFQIPVRQYARRLPALALDIPRSMRRMLRKDWRDLPEDVELRRYPPYYRRNFHWQTDGYLSRRSAELYDVGVELLFLGTADVMRRQVIPPVSRWLRETGAEDGRLLDVACGTGRGLRQMAAALPKLHLYGLDLSPYYLQVAREVLADVPDVSLVADNAESMPFRDGFFDALTSIYLFHELPRNARRNVLAEMFRVLRPGGLLVIEDSAQLAESAQIAQVLQRFSRDFHEPFYEDYIRDDLAEALRATGFEVVDVDPCFVAKVVTARKPRA